jgi:FMN phosphatase YigB (HAD superfamily)
MLVFITMNTEQFKQLIEPFDNIIFDYGGILIDIDYNQTVEAFVKLSGSEETREVYSKTKQIPIFDLIETGKISKEEFIKELGIICKAPNANKEEIVKAWCAMLGDIRVERVAFLRELRKTKRIFMLSNINQVHEEFADDYIKNREEIKDFYSLFEKKYFSHHIGFRKPEKEAFELVINENGLDPKKTLFIDDSPGHIEGAKACGLNTHLLTPPNSLIVS